ncbi:(2Fe-2S) ferredoxin domain-containing protein [Bdellovibrio sp. 22V]|uniref:(2Fe-2S) ferredoxin domain-containing protein n=1 Tax=Bdellovibrio TaxID=958 RepID=UPI0025437449|nr:(2Fe-2S) ferredoxin domain-containing protein [Bdellovibrio sp. 22V]WII70689.1 (2Fe-2S) ferredoxin domain-containing protein [Bdellovibrio sp. 22V]
MLKAEETPWSQGIVLICTKCHKSISSSSLKEEGNSGENLKTFLKKSLKETGDLSKVRVVTTSCLDVCIDDYQAVTYAPVEGETQTFTVHPEKDREELLNFIRDEIND